MLREYRREHSGVPNRQLCSERHHGRLLPHRAMGPSAVLSAQAATLIRSWSRMVAPASSSNSAACRDIQHVHKSRRNARRVRSPLADARVGCTPCRGSVQSDDEALHVQKAPRSARQPWQRVRPGRQCWWCARATVGRGHIAGRACACAALAA